mgnify:CR=1 FL=1
MALTKSEAKLKRENPEKFRKLQEMRKRRRGKRQLEKPAKRTIRTLSPASPVKVTPIGNVKRGSMKPGLDAAAAAAKKRDAAKAAKRSAPKPPKKFKSNVARGTMKPGLDAVAASAKKREPTVKRITANPVPVPTNRRFTPKPPPAVVPTKPIKRTPKVNIGTEDPAANVGPGKTTITNPKGEGSLTGLSMKELMSKIEDAEFPTDPDDPSAYDIEDLKADLKQLKGLKKGGSVKKKVRKKKTAVKKRAALRGYGKALRGF